MAEELKSTKKQLTSMIYGSVSRHDDRVISGTRRHPVVAIRCGCRGGDGYGYAPGCSVKQGATTDAPMVPRTGLTPVQGLSCRS